jgi:capsid protein
MANTAFMNHYREGFIPSFEYGQSRLRTACVTETVISGNSAIFLVAGTGGAEAVTRGVNGLIPSRNDSLTQNTATLQEWHDKPQRTKFNIFGSQGDGRRIMQQGTIKVINRKVDSDIIAQLDTATNDTGAYTTASLEMVAKSKAILGNNEVDTSDADNMFAVVTPAFMAYLLQVKEFASADYVETKPLAGPTRQYLRWAGVNWIEHPQLTGVGTTNEKCYMFHRDAIGHAIDMDNMDISAGYNEEDSYYWARCSTFMGSKLLQNSGVVQMKHDGSAFAAS